MLVNVGDILLDRDNRRAGREVEVVSVEGDSITIRTIKSIGGVPVSDGTVSVVGKVRLGKAYRRKFPEVITGDDIKVEHVEISGLDVSKMTEGSLKKDIIESIMELAEPGNQAVLNRITALESRVNGLEYGGSNYYYGSPTITCGTITSEEVNHTSDALNINTMTGSVVTNYPSVEEVLEKVLPETESDEFEYLWERLASEGKNPHEAVVRLVYNLLTK